MLAGSEYINTVRDARLYSVLDLMLAFTQNLFKFNGCLFICTRIHPPVSLLSLSTQHWEITRF